MYYLGILELEFLRIEGIKWYLLFIFIQPFGWYYRNGLVTRSIKTYKRHTLACQVSHHINSFPVRQETVDTSINFRICEGQYIRSLIQRYVIYRYHWLKICFSRLICICLPLLSQTCTGIFFQSNLSWMTTKHSLRPHAHQPDARIITSFRICGSIRASQGRICKGISFGVPPPVCCNLSFSTFRIAQVCKRSFCGTQRTSILPAAGWFTTWASAVGNDFSNGLEV